VKIIGLFGTAKEIGHIMWRIRSLMADAAKPISEHLQLAKRHSRRDPGRSSLRVLAPTFGQNKRTLSIPAVHKPRQYLSSTIYPPTQFMPSANPVPLVNPSPQS
jgi:hypothetical protein